MKIQFFRYKFNFEKYWTEKYWNRKKVMINTNTTISKSIENNQYKYFLKVLKIPIVLIVKGLFMILNSFRKTECTTYVYVGNEKKKWLLANFS